MPPATVTMTSASAQTVSDLSRNRSRSVSICREHGPHGSTELVKGLP